MKFFNKKKPVKSIDIDSLLESDDYLNIVITLDEYINQLYNYAGKIEELTQPQQNLLFIENLEREINNGGFSQFYFNSSGDYSLETVDALMAIEAPKTAEIVKRANSQFPDGKIPKDRTHRQEFLLQIEEKAGPVWNTCDNEFYIYQEDLVDLLVKYVKQNKDLFR